MASTIDLINQGIALSKQSIALADAEDWDAFADIETQRQSLMRKVTVESSSLTTTEIVALREAMQQMITMNKEIEQRCIQHRSQLGSELQNLRQGSKAHKAYTE